MNADERKREIDRIRAISDQITELGRHYDRMRWMAEQPHSSDAYVQLAKTAGELTLDSLAQLATLMEIMFKIGKDSEL